MNTIDESLAKRANDAMSMNDYKPGTATREYAEALSSLYKIIENADTTKASEDDIDDAKRVANSFMGKYAKWTNKHNAVIASCPSFLVAGYIPEGKKEKQNERLDAVMREYPDYEECERRIRFILSGNRPIQADDPQAVEKLTKKLEDEKAAHALMIKANAYYRKNKTLDGFEDEATIKTGNENLEYCTWEHKPFPTFELSNSNARIKRLQARIDGIRENRGNAAVTLAQGDGWSAENDKVAMRIRIYFDEKPDGDTRALLKKHGFKWAPSAEAWQRLNTTNALDVFTSYIKPKLA